MYHRYYILLIEDTPELREDLSLELQDGGYHVEEASDGHAALAAFGRAKPDLVICDMHLPDMDGVTLLKSIRAAEDDKTTIPIIVVSAFSHAEIQRDAEAFDIVTFIVKPVDYTKLLAIVAKCLRDP